MIRYEVDPQWVQPVDCYCVVRHGVWHVAWRCTWHGGKASPERLKKHHPIVKVVK